MINILIILPLLGILGVVVISNKTPDKKILDKRNKVMKQIALGSSLLTFLGSLIIWCTFDTTVLSFQFVQEYKPLYFFEFNLGIDGISLPFILLTTLTMPICLMSSWNNIKVEIKHFLIAFLLLEILLISVFLSLDLLLFYVFFESVLPPLFLIIGVWGHGNNKVRASYLLFLYTLIGSLFMLMSILGFILVIGSSNYHLLFLTDLTAETQFILWLGFFIALAVKTPLFPFHIWLYRAHAEAPLAGSVLLAGVILKLATYGYIRVLLAMLPESTFYFIPFVQGIAVITILYSALTTLRQTDIKCCIAYSSVTHMGFVVLALCSNNIQGIEGAILLSIAHGLVSPALFICVGGVLYDRYKTRIIKYYRGLTLTMPVFSTLFFIFILGNISVPLSLNFVGEFMALTGSYIKNPILTIFAAFGIVLGACYSLWLYNRVGFGPFSPYLLTTNDVSRREFNLLAPLAVLTIGLGIFPNIIMDLLHCSVSELLFNGSDAGYILFIGCSLKLKSNTISQLIKGRRISFKPKAQSETEAEHKFCSEISDNVSIISLNSVEGVQQGPSLGTSPANQKGGWFLPRLSLMSIILM